MCETGPSTTRTGIDKDHCCEQAKQQRNTMCLLTHPPAHDKASDSGDHGDAAEWTTDGPEVCSCTGAQPAVHCVGLQKHWTTKDHQRRVLASRTIIVMNRRSETKHHVPLDTHSSLAKLATTESIEKLQDGRQTCRRRASAQRHSRRDAALGCQRNGRHNNISDEYRR